MIPGYTSIKVFAEQVNINCSTARRHMRQGYCAWPYHQQSGRSNHLLYKTWEGMNARCYHKSHLSYAYYGARGITVCDKWRLDFWQFVKDVGERPDESYSLDRIDNNKGYYPENCRWVTYRDQMRNRRQSTGNIEILKGAYRGHLSIKGKRLRTPSTPDYEQAQIDLEQLEHLYQDYL